MNWNALFVAVGATLAVYNACTGHAAMAAAWTFIAVTNGIVAVYELTRRA